MQSVNLKQQIEQFLREFKSKLDFWGVVFLDDRGKNFSTLSTLEIRPADREQVLKTLKVSDYSQGPLDEDWYGSKEMWVFGNTIKSHEIYIKITLGAASAKTICVSFHTSEYPMEYPFK